MSDSFDHTPELRLVVDNSAAFDRAFDLFKRIKAAFINPQFQTDVYKPLKLDDFIDQEVQNLSGGELQRVAIVLALGMPADLYLIDEPSAYLDSEQRIIAARVIKRDGIDAVGTADDAIKGHA